MRISHALATCAALLVAVQITARPARAQSLRGSPESVERMYEEAQRESLAFHETPDDVRAAAGSGALVALTPSRDVTLKNVGYPYVTPAALAFVERLGALHRATCGKPLVVTSAARPTTRQPRNSVAQSVHPTGMAVDLHKPNGKCLRWLRATLLELEDAGALEATEEFRPPHFHVAVYPTAYTQYAATQRRAPAERTLATRAVTTVTTTVAAAKPAPRREPTRVQRTPTRVAAAPRAARRYRVRSGDTLWDIARAHDVSVKQLLAANGMARPKIRPGQRLVLPKASASTLASHEVADGQ